MADVVRDVPKETRTGRTKITTTPIEILRGDGAFRVEFDLADADWSGFTFNCYRAEIQVGPTSSGPWRHVASGDNWNAPTGGEGNKFVQISSRKFVGQFLRVELSQIIFMRTDSGVTRTERDWRSAPVGMIVRLTR